MQKSRRKKSSIKRSWFLSSDWKYFLEDLKVVWKVWENKIVEVSYFLEKFVFWNISE
jgi:hypothetical protein